MLLFISPGLSANRAIMTELLYFVYFYIFVSHEYVFLSNVEVVSTLSQVVTIIDLACEDEKASALSSLLYVPILKVDALKDDSAHKFLMSIRPSYHVVSQALFDVMDVFEFSRVAVVYDGKLV